MRHFSGKFIALIESMKSEGDSHQNLLEKDRQKTGTFRDRERTSSGKLASREEKRTARREDNFLTGSEMSLKAFLKALESLKSQIIAENSGVYNAVNNKGEGAKYGLPIMRGLEATLKNVLDLIASVNTKMSRKGAGAGEGNYLSMTDDSADIESYRTLYNKAKDDYAKYSSEWIEAARKDRLERPVDNKNKEIEASINSAITFFNKARELYIQNSSAFVKSAPSSSTTSGSTGTTAAIDLTETIKERKEAYTGKEAETIKSVKLMIYEKFKKYSKLAASSDWKIVFKDPKNPTATLRANTASVIKAIKAGLAKDYPDLSSDKTGNITPAFVKVLSELKEGLHQENSKIISFSDFMKKRVNEGFDEDTAVTTISGGSSSAKVKSKSQKVGGKKVSEYPATPFKKQEEGDAFRAWVIKNKPDWAKANSLDATGPRDNNYIRKAYSEFGKDYSAPTVKVEKKKITNKQFNDMKAYFKEKSGFSSWSPTWTAEIGITSDTSEPYLYFKGDNKEYGGIYNNFRMTYTTTSGKKYIGTVSSDFTKIKFDNGKTITFADLKKNKFSEKVAAEGASTAQGKKAYVSKTGDGYVNVRSSAAANTGFKNNLIYKHTNQSTPIGLVLSSTVSKSSKIGDKTWYKVQFPTKKEGYEYGYVRSDTVDLK